MRDLRERVAVVTGAASGIGQALALELARKGCHLALVTRRNKRGLEDTATGIEALGRKVSLHMADVSKREQMEALPEEVVAVHGHVHILVNNAGVTLMGDLEQQTFDDFEWVLGINLWGVIFGCKVFLPHLMREGEAHVVNISSIQGLLALHSQTSYVASKFAVRGLGESLRGELQPHGIGVTTVFPGMINTNVVRASRTAGEEGAKLKEWTAKYFAAKALAPEKCARKIVRGIEKNKARVLITPESHIADALKRLFPSGTDTVMSVLQRLRPD